jgi:hypothetical protein
MANFISKGILVNYGLKRMLELLKDNSSNINFSKIKIGDGNGNNITLDTSLTEMINPVYTLPISNIILGNKITTFIATIPDSIKEFNIKEIGLYETRSNKDYLIAISPVNLNKPAYVNYDLIIEVHYNLDISNVDYNLISIGVKTGVYPPKSLINNFDTDVLYKMKDILEEIVALNNNALTNLSNPYNIDNVFNKFIEYNENLINLLNTDTNCKNYV